MIRARTHALVGRTLSYALFLTQILRKAGKLRKISSERSVDDVWSATQALFDSNFQQPAEATQAQEAHPAEEKLHGAPDKLQYAPSRAKESAAPEDPALTALKKELEEHKQRAAQEKKRNAELTAALEKIQVRIARNFNCCIPFQLFRLVKMKQNNTL